MERPTNTSTTNPEFIKSTLGNMKINLTLNLEEIKKIEEMLDKSSKGVLEPVRRLNNFFTKDLKSFKVQYEEILGKVTKKFQSVEEKLNGSKEEAEDINISIINEECNLNLTLANDHPRLNETLERSLKIVNLFNNLFNSKEFDSLIKEFNMFSELLTSNCEDNIINALMGEEERERKIIKKNKKKKLLQNKRKRLSENHLNGNGDIMIDVNDPQNGKNKKQKSSQNSSAEKIKNKISDEECVEIIKNAFPDVKTISKTFLTRKLTKKVTWASEYDFKECDFEKNQKEIVKSATYKYVKLSFNIEDRGEYDFDSNFVKIFTGQLKNYMIKLDNINNMITVAGELDKLELEDFLKSLKDVSHKENFLLLSAKVEVYAFFEELFFEFETDGFQIFKNLNDDEVEKIKVEWERIKQLRVMWKDLKGITNK